MTQTLAPDEAAFVDAVHLELAESLRRSVAHLGFEAVLSVDADDGRPRLTLADVGGSAFDPLVARVAQIGGIRDRRVAATYLHGYLGFYLLTPLLGLLVDERRLLQVRPTDVRLLWDEERPVTVAFGGHAGRLSVLPGDPLAGSHDVIVRTDELELIDHLHDTVVGLFEPLVGDFRRAAGLSSRLQWSQVADRAAMTLQYAARQRGREAAGVALAEQLLGRADSPLRTRRGGFVTVRVEDIERTIYQRSACCGSYQTAVGEYCLTCPVLREPERRRRMEAWVRNVAAVA